MIAANTLGIEARPYNTGGQILQLLQIDSMTLGQILHLLQGEDTHNGQILHLLQAYNKD